MFVMQRLGDRLRLVARVLAACGVLGGPAMAHVTASPSEASAGARQAVRFQVGHGCAGAATTSLRVEIPREVNGARPQPKPGWTLAISRDEGRVAAVTWTGLLPADQFDDFGLLIEAPDTPGPLYFPVVQSCAGTTEQWNELPEPDQTAPLTRPAPKVTITPAVGESHHVH